MGYFKNLVVEVDELRNQGFSKEAIANWFHVEMSVIDQIFEMLNEKDIYND